MPTHQGKTQTDIVIGDGGDSTSAQGAIEVVATLGGMLDLHVAESSTLLSHEATLAFTVRDAVGAALCGVHARLVADASIAGATAHARTRTADYEPLPAGEAPSWPAAPATFATRDWSVGTSGLGSQSAAFEVTTSAAPGVTVSQVITAQSSARLALALTFRQGRTTLLTATVTCDASVTATGSAVPAAPVVVDQLG